MKKNCHLKTESFYRILLNGNMFCTLELLVHFYVSETYILEWFIVQYHQYFPIVSIMGKSNKR